MKKYRFTVLILSIILCSALVGCSYRQIDPSDDDLTVVGHVGDKEVYLEELRFVTNTYRELLISRYGDDIFDGKDREYYLELLREQVYKNITADYAVISLCEEYSIRTGDATIIDAVDKRMTETVPSRKPRSCGRVSVSL